jgi:hypothetical protein
MLYTEEQPAPEMPETLIKLTKAELLRPAMAHLVRPCCEAREMHFSAYASL